MLSWGTLSRTAGIWEVGAGGGRWGEAIGSCCFRLMPLPLMPLMLTQTEWMMADAAAADADANAEVGGWGELLGGGGGGGGCWEGNPCSSAHLHG